MQEEEKELVVFTGVGAPTAATETTEAPPTMAPVEGGTTYRGVAPLSAGGVPTLPLVVSDTQDTTIIQPREARPTVRPSPKEAGEGNMVKAAPTNFLGHSFGDGDPLALAMSKAVWTVAIPHPQTQDDPASVKKTEAQYSATSPPSARQGNVGPPTVSLAIHGWRSTHGGRWFLDYQRFRDPRTESLYLVSRCWTIRVVTITCLLAVLGQLLGAVMMLPTDHNPVNYPLYSHLVRGMFVIVMWSLFIANIVMCELYPSPPDSLPVGGSSTRSVSSESKYGSIATASEQGVGSIKSSQLSTTPRLSAILSPGNDTSPTTSTPATDEPLQAGFKEPIMIAKRHEAIATILLCLQILGTVLNPQLVEFWPGTCPEGKGSAACTGQLYVWPGVLFLFACTIVTLRVSIACPLLVAFNVLSWMLRWAMRAFYARLYKRYNVSLRPVVPWLQWQTIATWSFCIGLILVCREKFHRRCFITRLLLLEKERCFTVQSLHYNETLRMLLPGSAVAKLAAGLVVEDYAQVCTISVCEVKDFARWSTSLRPQCAMEAVDIFWACIDVYLSEMRDRTTVRKALMAGDCYVVAAGLREEETPAPATRGELNRGVDENGKCIFSYDCCRFASRVACLFPLAAKFNYSVGVGISRGSCYGSILGQRFIRYNLAGPAFRQAMHLARISRCNKTFVDEETVLQLDTTSELMLTPVVTGLAQDGIFNVQKTLPASCRGDGRDLDAPKATQPEKEESRERVVYTICRYPGLVPVLKAPEVELLAQPPEEEGDEKAGHEAEESGIEDGKSGDDTVSPEYSMQQLHESTARSGMEFVSKETEVEFWSLATQAAGARTLFTRQIIVECKLDLLCSLMLMLVFFIIPIYEENASASWRYFLLVLGGGLVMLLRLGLWTTLPRRFLWLAYWALLVQNSLFLVSTLFIGGTKGEPTTTASEQNSSDTMQRSLLNRSHGMIVLFMYVIILQANSLLSWKHSIPMTLAHSIVGAVTTMYSRYGGTTGNVSLDGEVSLQEAKHWLLSQEALPCFLPVLVVFGAHTREHDRRAYFVTDRLGRGVTQLLERKMESHKGLLHNMVPPYVIPNVMAKISLECCCVTQPIPDCVVLALQILPVTPTVMPTVVSAQERSESPRGADERSEEDTPTWILATGARVSCRTNDQKSPNPFSKILRDHFGAVESALLDLQAEAAHCSLIHMIGDTILLGGPMLDLKSAQAESLPNSEVEGGRQLQLGPSGDREKDSLFLQEEAAGRCAKVLVSTLGRLHKKFDRQLTATLAYGNGYAAVLGEYLPSFDLLGSACRAAQEILEAAPQGFLGCTQGFLRFVNVLRTGSPDWAATGFQYPSEESSWRLRGAGQVRVFSLKPLNQGKQRQEELGKVTEKKKI